MDILLSRKLIYMAFLMKILNLFTTGLTNYNEEIPKRPLQIMLLNNFVESYQGENIEKSWELLQILVLLCMNYMATCKNQQKKVQLN